jgi:hypothetical protein
LRKTQKKAIIIPFSTRDISRRSVLAIGGGVRSKRVRGVDFEEVRSGLRHEHFWLVTVQ